MGRVEEIGMETLVFLHHWGIGPENYNSLINSLRKKYQVIAPNLSSLTENKKDFSLEEFAKNLDKLIGRKKIYLLGVSLGGVLALSYACHYPDKVKVVVVCEPGGIKFKRSKVAWSFLIVKMLVRALFYPRGIRVVLRVCFSFLKESILNFRKLDIQAKLGLKMDLADSLAKIKSPVFLFWSEKPDLVPLSVGKRLHQGIATSKFNPSFSNKNHLWPLFEQEKIAKEVFKKF